MQAEKIFSGFLHIGSPSFVLVHIGLVQFYYIVGWNAKGICGYESGNNIYGMCQQFPASPPTPSTFPTIHAIPCVSLWNPCTNSYARTLEKWTETAPRSKMLCLGFMTVKRQQKMKMWPWRVSPPALTGSVRRGSRKIKKIYDGGGGIYKNQRSLTRTLIFILFSC